MVHSLPSRLPPLSIPQTPTHPRAAARPIPLSPHRILAALAVAVFLVLGVVVMTTRATRSATSSGERVAHAQQTVSLAGQLLVTLNEAETGVRRYVRSGDEASLATYSAARARYPRELANLQSQLEDRLEFAPVLARLRTHLDVKFAEFTQALEVHRGGGPELAALAVVMSEESASHSSAIRTLLQSLQGAELDDLADHADTVTRQVETFHALGLGFAELAVALAALAAWLLVRRTRRAEEVAKVCAWTRRVRWDGEWISFEEYLARRFNVMSTHGISEEAAQQMEREILAAPAAEDLAESRPVL